MYLNNSFNILPWYDSLAKRSSQKWYAFGQSWPLLCPKGRILPFQFVCEKIEILSTVFAVDVKTGAATDLKVTPTVLPSTQADATYYVVKMPSTQVIELPVGLYYLRFNTSLGYLYSEEISIIDDAEECVKIEYWNEDTLKFTSGEINFEDNFKFELYLRTTIGKPEYEFEEELTKRLGYKFIESQTSNKLYKFAFVAPEYICDAMRLIRLCDYIKITTKFDSYNALSFAYEPKWQEQGDLAAVDAEFDTDCIIQKLESFNRRLRESFYNALLAEIDEPVLFSTDTVAQYYTEFTSTSYINGKLIRQLESMPISELRDSLADIVLPADNQSDNSQAAKKVFLSDVLSLVEAISNYFKPHYSSDGQLEWIEALAHIGVRGGVTMYIDGGNLNLPSIYEGLPIDWKTLIRDANGVLMVNPDIELGGGITTWDELQGKPSWIGSSKPVYSYSEIQGAPDLSNYALSSDVEAVSTKLNDFLEGSDTDNIINKWKELETFLSGLSQSDNLATILGNKAEKTDLAKYIPIAGVTDITGEKNFVGGLKVNGSPIYYDTEKKYWKLEGDLLVTGGVTMFGNDSDFVASTIMDAILYDDTTLGINSSGQLYVKGSVGGATTLGGLANVGSWADSVASQDRIMYQAANSSQWVAKNLSDLTVGGVTGDYLPLSGGTLTGTLYLGMYGNTTYTTGLITVNSDGLTISGIWEDFSKLLKRPIILTWRGGYADFGGLRITGYSDAELGGKPILHAGNYSSYALPLSGGTINGQLKINTSLDYPFTIKRNSTNASYVAFENNNGYLGDIGFLSDGSLYAYVGGSNKTIWHSGNDGSGSGLDADLLDGYDSSYIMKYGGNWTASTDTAGIFAFGFGGPSAGFANNYGAGIQLCNAQAVNAKPSSNNNKANWYSQLLFGTDNRVYARFNTNGIGWSSQNKIAYVTDNVASATKLQTARTIWGQSFDGSGNVDGTLSTAHNNFFLSADGGNTQLLGYSQKDGYYGLGYSAGVKGITTHLYGGHIRLYSGTVETVRVVNGNVGIGTTNPREKLEVSNYALIGGNIIVGGGAIGFNRNTYQGGRYDTKYQGWQIDIVGDTLNFYTEGSLGNGIKVKFDASGNILATGGVTMYSDSRKKTILNRVELSLQQVANAPLIEYYYNSDQNKTTHVGSIAQYWASMNDWFCKKDSEGFYTMEIQNAALASAISVARELVKFESETDRRIRLLEEENKRLKEEVEYLKLNVA